MPVTSPETSDAPMSRRVCGNVLLYGLPSIADRSFLQAALQTKRIGRSLFFGFGETRTAIVELLDPEAAKGIYAALKNLIPHENDLHSTTAEDLLNVNVPLIDLYLGETPDALPYHYLHFLRSRRAVIRVAWSPVPVEAFYQTGGVVPDHKTVAAENPGEKRGPQKTGEMEPRHGVKRAHREVEDEESGGTATQAVAPPDEKRPKISQFFPKNCCQKCGSPDHFTRHCDATEESIAAAAASAATSQVETPPSDEGSTKASKRDSTLTATATTASSSGSTTHNNKNSQNRHEASGPGGHHAHSTPSASPKASKKSGEACQHCGSADHFSRHCPQK